MKSILELVRGAAPAEEMNYDETAFVLYGQGVYAQARRGTDAI
jgi:hypothetical protein